MLKLVNASIRNYEDLDKFGLLEDNHSLSEEQEVLFARLDIKEVNEQVRLIQEAQKKEYEEEVFLEPQEKITIDDFAKIA